MTTCVEPNHKEAKAISSGDFTREVKRQQEKEFRCPECSGLVSWFKELWMCMACHKRRTERQAQTGRTLLTTLELEKVKEHSDDNPL